jgi:hypothetical protein
MLAAVLLVGLGLTLLLTSPSEAGQDSTNAPLFWALTVGLSVVAGTGALWLRRTETARATTETNDVRLGWYVVPVEVVLPSMLVAGFALILQVFEGGIVQALVLSMAAVAFAAVYWAQTHSVDARERYFPLSQIVLNVLSHLAAFLLFSIIYGLKARALFSASAVGLITFLLVVEMLLRDTAWREALHRGTVRTTSSLVLLAAGAGIVVAELTWGLNYWAALTTLVGGAFLLVAFYVATGLISHYIEGTLDRASFVEFGTVAAVAMLVVFGSAFISNG